LIFAPIRKRSFSTMGGELSSYVGGSENVRQIVSIFVVLSSIGWLGAHILGGAKYLQFITGMNPQLCKSLIALGFGIYVIIGGYRAVVWTDSIQAILLFAGFLMTAILCIQLSGGWESIQSQAHELNKLNGNPPILHSISLIVTIAVGILGAPSFRQRIYSGESVISIRKAFVLSGGLFLVFSILPVTIGIAAFGANPDLESADLAFPHMAMKVLPVWAGIIVIVSGISATLSSASSDAIAATGTILKDIHLALFKKVPNPERIIANSRYALAGTILLALVMAMSSDSIIGYIEKMISLFMSGLTMTALLGKLWPRFNASGAISTIVVAFFVALSFEWNAAWRLFWGNACLPSLMLSGFAGIVVSLLTPPDVQCVDD
ncbi:MAG: sodium:solute symporter family protein, partial [Verrucomicrobia bacterium]|nr:sodium:solute symporter family protein [Verrucomicrobiota bacterium]